jgi:hypothetical protein
MTTLLEMRTGVQSLSGDLSGVLFTNTDVNRYINQGVNEIVKRTRCLQKATVVSNATLISGDVYGGVLLPADFVIELDVYYGTVAAPVRLMRMNLAQFNADTVQTGGGTPTMYSIGNYDATTGQRVMYFYPWMTPGLVNQSYIIRYVPDPPLLVGDSDVVPTPQMLDEVLMFFALRRCKIQENDFQSASALQGEIDQKLNEFQYFMNDHGELANFQLPEESVATYSVFEV